jgi:predicted metal-dependent HD superfamily phosphohydrolase
MYLILKENWSDLLLKLNADLQYSEKIFQAVINAYCNPARHYHNLEHIQQILQAIEEVKYLSNCPNIISLSAWFHDYVYCPERQDNEEKSAEYAKINLNKLKISNQIIEAVKQIIISTKTHYPLLDNIDNLIFLDADLSILGTSPERYWRYAQAIRQEYHWLSDRDYQQGRTKVLNNFLARDKIYYTDYFYRQLEKAARNNLKSEIHNINRNT